MPRITGSTPDQRLHSLTTLVGDHINSSEVKARMKLDNITCDINKVAIAAYACVRPSDSLPIPVEHKPFVAFGWNTDDKRTLIFFIKSEMLHGLAEVPVTFIKKHAIKPLTAILTH